jgi:flagellar hook-associated protein 3 FlgL
MRVTFQAAYGGAEYAEIAASQVARARQQVMSGKRLQKASDDPGAMQRSVEGRGEIRAIETYQRTADTATARLALLDSTLASVVETLQQAKVTTASARNSTATTLQRETAAQTLEGVRDALAAQLNTSSRGVYLFGGSQTTAPPFVRVAGTWTYQGDASPQQVDVAPGQAVAFSRDGQALAQGTQATNILNDLDALVAAVRTGNQAGMTTGMTSLDRAFERASREQIDVGADQEAIAELEGQLTLSRLAAVTRVSKDEDADLTAAISELTRADTAYRAALGAIGRASRTSLMDYLR